MDRSVKAFFAVNLLVVALLFITNLVINPDALGAWGTTAAVIALGGSISLWVWLWLDNRPAAEVVETGGELQLPQRQIQEWNVPVPVTGGVAPVAPLPFPDDEVALAEVDVLEPEIVPANVTVTDEVQAVPTDTPLAETDVLEPEIAMSDVLVTDEVQAIPADVMVTDEVPRVVIPAKPEVTPASLEPDVVPATITPTDNSPATVPPLVASEVPAPPEPGDLDTAVDGATTAADNPAVEPAEVAVLHEVPVLPEVPTEDFPAVAAAVPSATGEIDNLTRIEGIGPKYNQTLHDAGINTFTQLAAASQEQLTEILHNGGYTRIPASVATWAEQAGYLVRNDLEGLKKLQDELVGGRRPGTGDD